jgi:hypothetical protein
MDEQNFDMERAGLDIDMRNVRIETLDAGPLRIVNVIFTDKEKKVAMVGVRRADNPEEVLIARHAEILGACCVYYTPNDPVPGTNGRGICVMRTTAAICVYIPTGEI